ncbi:hypothetical protein HPB52_006705 [Rhipicephalus sanguineus]|uniref:Uncharacterized protein n=1 Tax=Rhipicephalus sanguineus TaxID=34632 RepID=A0A9D4PI56_RHISA|nr:hypothetical protein HPB52_006705 [Rhipicephalus sanguineus]
MANTKTTIHNSDKFVNVEMQNQAYQIPEDKLHQDLIIRTLPNNAINTNSSSTSHRTTMFIIPKTTTHNTDDFVSAEMQNQTSEVDKLNVLIRKATKLAMGLPPMVSTTRLLRMGVHNTWQEVVEAQRTSQLERLRLTSTGRSVLARHTSKTH